MKVNKMVSAGSEIQSGAEELSILLRQAALRRQGKKTQASSALMACG